MQFLVHYEITPEHRDMVNERLRKFGLGWPEGLTMVNDYRSVTQLEGWAIIESNDARALWGACEAWTNLNVNHVTPVLGGDDLTNAL